jgi:small subunit ribosomal protein S1
MSTPETTPQVSTLPSDVDSSPEPSTASGSSDAAVGVAEQAPAAPSLQSEQAPVGTADASEVAADAGDSTESTEEAAHGESDAPSAAAGDGDKKKRRRRRRKKSASGTPAPGEGVPAEGAEASAEPSGEGASEAPGTGENRERKREKRHGAPRERAPVTLGDIVFGKIIDITEEAILVDIPGKAKAIFDRRELLLPDEDDERSTGRPPPVDATATPSTPAAAIDSAAEAVTEGAPALAAPADVAQDAATTDAVAVDRPLSSASEVAHDHALDSATATESAVVEAPGTAVDVAASNADDLEKPREVKDPKVPHVVLEVGADFIGVVHSDGGRGGLVVLTHHPRRAEKAKSLLEKAFTDATLVQGLVTGVIKGGIEVDVDGLRAFAPGSHVDMHMGADLSYLVGERLPFVVTQYAKRGRDVVLSRKAMIEEEARKARIEALARLKVGEELEGIVRSVVPFGAFVDLGGIEGLVPLQEMSHNRGDGPSDVFKAGEPTRVKVIKIDDKGKVWLSHKATVPDPWQRVAEKYAQGTRHAGKVVRLQPFGAFVELESGIDGLIHTQDLSAKRIESPEEVVKVGDAIEVVVAYVEPGQHKIALHPAPLGEAAGEVPQRVVPHKSVKAKVLAIESGGLVVRILGVTGRNARGYVTAAGTGTPRGTELRKAFNVGQDVEAKVIEIDPRRGEVKLSIKALSEDQERNAYQQYRQQLKAEARFTFGDLLKKGSPSR